VYNTTTKLHSDFLHFAWLRPVERYQEKARMEKLLLMALGKV